MSDSVNQSKEHSGGEGVERAAETADLESGLAGSDQAAETPWEDLRARALQDYEDKAIATHSWSSVIPQAINFYFDNVRRESPALIDETRETGN